MPELTELEQLIADLPPKPAPRPYTGPVIVDCRRLLGQFASTGPQELASMRRCLAILTTEVKILREMNATAGRLHGANFAWFMARCRLDHAIVVNQELGLKPSLAEQLAATPETPC